MNKSTHQTHNPEKMRSKTVLSAIFFVLFSVFVPRTLAADATISAGGDIKRPLMDAWKKACEAPGLSKITIPKGEHTMSGPTEMVGPCKGKIEVIVEGTVKAPKKLKGDTWVKFEHVDGLKLSGSGAFDGQGQAAWKANECSKDPSCDASAYNFRFHFLNRSTISGITSLNSKNFHVMVLGCNNITFKKFTITAPAESLNTDGIHIGRSKGVKILNTKIGTGDDCISIGDGSQDVLIKGVKCGPGHGISIGSLGRYPNEEPVMGVTVQNCTLTNTDNGLRIKSWPGLQAGIANKLHFEDVHMENVSNPVLIDQNYCPYNQCKKGTSSRVKISDVSFKRISGTSATPLAVQLVCSSGLPCESVQLEDVDLKVPGGAPATSSCTNVKPQISGRFTTAGCNA